MDVASELINKESGVQKTAPVGENKIHSIKGLLGILEAIYSGTDEEQPLQIALSLLRDYVDASWVGLLLRPATPTRDALIITAGGPVTLASSSPNIKGNEIPPGGAFWELEAGRVVQIDGPGTLPGYHVIGVDMLVSDAFRARLRIAKPHKEGAFGQSEIELIQALVPHLTRALEAGDQQLTIRLQLETQASIIESLSVGLVLLSDSDEILQMNRSAHRLVHADKGLCVRRGTLHCEGQSEDRRLWEAIKSVQRPRNDADDSQESGIALVSARPDSGAWLSLLVKPVAQLSYSAWPRWPAVAVCIRNPDQDRDLLNSITRQMFGLTRMEAALALQLTKCANLDDAAVALGIRRNTARTHLRAIFNKIGVTRQAELVRVIVNSVATMV
jgi:DNA-binding CsgD family transcriptional regulator